MAPTICLSELSVENNSPSVYIRRRQRNLSSSGIIRVEQQRHELRRILNNPSNDRVASLSPPAIPIWEPTCPTSSFSPNRDSGSKTSSNRTSISANGSCSQDWRSILARREGLLDIVARTMALVRRSHMLQKRVNALRYETREFIRSVLNNPENSGGKDFRVADGTSCSYVETVVSSSSEVLLQSRTITPPPTPDSSTSSSTPPPTEHVHILADTDNSVLSDADTYFYSNSSNSDYSSDESSDHYTTRKLTQDPMISSS